LTSGVNCVDEFNGFYQGMKDESIRFNVILASQFEHYCPNEHRSDLAEKYRKRGKTYSTKSEFRKLCHGLLKNRGIYFTIDDRFGEHPEEHAALCKAWDTFVVTQATDPEVLQQIRLNSPNLAKKLAKRYDPSLPMDKLVGIAGETRAHRRGICDEEIEPLTTTLNDLKGIFGKDNVNYIMHPSRETHPGFYLAYAVKR